jgi:hypothetical protein
MRTVLRLLLVAAVVAGCASAAPTDPRTEVPIADVKMLVGTWTGYVIGGDGLRADNVSLVISDKGSYQASGHARGGGFTINGEITAGNGKASYRSTRSSGTVALFKAGNKEILRFDGSTALSGGHAEWERGK